MNERIKELRRIAQNEVCFQAHEENNRKWTTEEVDAKFAELIVRECMDICKQHPSRIVSNNWDADAVAPDIVHRFEEHFGVEE